MADPVRKKRAKATRRKPNAPLTQMIVADALRSWVLPAIGGIIGLAVFVANSIELMDSDAAVTVVGTVVLVLVLFFGLRTFTEGRIGGRLAAALLAFVVVWAAATWYPFFRALNPGTPLFTGELKQGGEPVTLPIHGASGHYQLLVQGHFPPVEGRLERAATYKIALGHGGTTDQVLEGTFRQEWHQQRFGTGRRSSTVPVMKERAQVLSPVDDADGHDLTLKLTDLSAGVRDSVTVKLFPGGPPTPVVVALEVLSVMGALLIDAWRPRDSSPGLMATLTVAVIATLTLFQMFDTHELPQLFIAALAGALVGGIVGSVVSRLVAPLRRRVPALQED